MNALKSLYLFLNNHMKWVAIVLVATLVPVAVVPALGWVVIATLICLDLLMFVGDYPCNWIAEVEIK